MTTPTNDEHEPAIVGETQAEAQQLVKALSSYLQMLGWDAIIISLSRRVDVGGEAFAPGATATVIDKPRVAPVIGQLATVMRMQADMLEKYAGEDADVGSGYVQDYTNYASGMSEWPK